MSFSEIKHQRFILGLLACAMAIASCESSISDKQKQRLADTYTQVLLVINMFPNDTTRANAAIDSVLHSFDYDDRQDFNDDLKKAAQNSGTMREILDSVQIQLRRIQTKDR